jgi:hypothetical protein
MLNFRRYTMIVTTPYSHYIRDALDKANKHLGGNLVFKECELVKTRRDGRHEFRVTLTVKDSKEIGSRRSPEGRRIGAACWHAYGLFLDSLHPDCEVKTTMGRLGMQKIRPGEKWQDYNIGSEMRPFMASHACNCMDWNTSGVLPFPVNV